MTKDALHISALTCAVFLCGPVPAQESAPAPEIVFQSVDGSPSRGAFVSFSLDEGLTVEEEGQRRQIPADHVIFFERVDDGGKIDSAMPALSQDSAILEFANGDRVQGRLSGAPSSDVVIESVDLGTISTSLEQLAGALFAAGRISAHADSGRWFRATMRSEDDRVLMTNGDVARGFVTGLSQEGVQLDVAGQARTIPLRLAVAARFVHGEPVTPVGLHAVLGLAGEQRLTVGSLTWDKGRISAQTPSGIKVTPPAGKVRSVHIGGGRWEWLSARRPAIAEHTPMLNLEWRYSTDRNVTGGPLQVDRKRFERGIGVHSRCRLVYDVRGEYRELVTSFGIDDDSGPMADVTATIFVDGERRFERNHVRRGTLHGPIRVNLEGARRIELLVEFGDNGDVQDRFNWIEAGLIRS